MRLGPRYGFLSLAGALFATFTTALDKDMSLLTKLVQLLYFQDSDIHTLRASFLEKLLSQCVQGNGFTAR